MGDTTRTPKILTMWLIELLPLHDNILHNDIVDEYKILQHDSRLDEVRDESLGLFVDIFWNKIFKIANTFLVL